MITAKESLAKHDRVAGVPLEYLAEYKRGYVHGYDGDNAEPPIEGESHAIYMNAATWYNAGFANGSDDSDEEYWRTAPDDDQQQEDEHSYNADIAQAVERHGR